MKMETNSAKGTGRHKKIAAVVTAVAVVAAGSAAAIIITHNNSSSVQTTNYRQYSVSQGDVTVGTTESGTVALDDVTVTFPVECTIGSVAVKSGQSVKKGDALLKLDLSSVSSNTSDLKQKLEGAKVSLQQAINDQKGKLDAAEITYESSKYLATSAPVTKSLTLSDLQNSIATAQNTLASDQKDLTTYTALQKSWSADYAKLQELKQWMNDADTAKTDYTNQLTQFNDTYSSQLSYYDSLKKTMDTDEANYITATAAGGTVSGKNAGQWDTQYETDKNTYDAYNSEVASNIISQQNTLEEKVAEYTAQVTNYTSAYNDFKDTYDDKYKVTGTDLDAKVTSLQNSVKTDQYNLEKAKETAQISSANAETAEATSLNAANNALDTYNLTVNQLAEAVTTAQEAYDNLESQMSEITSALNGDGTIKAPCDGIVAQINYKAGSTVPASTSFMTISKTSTVSMSASVSEDDIANVSVGQDASVTLSSQDGNSFDAVVESITAEPARSGSSSVTYTVVVKTKSDVSDIGTVYDGMSGEATIIQKRAKNVLYVSNKAITFKDGQSTVLVRGSDGNTTTKTVKTGFSNGTYVEVTSGLRKGETVLAESTVSSK